MNINKNNDERYLSLIIVAKYLQNINISIKIEELISQENLKNINIDTIQVNNLNLLQSFNYLFNYKGLNGEEKRLLNNGLNNFIKKNKNKVDFNLFDYIPEKEIINFLDSRFIKNDLFDHIINNQNYLSEERKNKLFQLIYSQNQFEYFKMFHIFAKEEQIKLLKKYPKAFQEETFSDDTVKKVIFSLETAARIQALKNIINNSNYEHLYLFFKKIFEQKLLSYFQKQDKEEHKKNAPNIISIINILIEFNKKLNIDFYLIELYKNNLQLFNHLCFDSIKISSNSSSSFYLDNNVNIYLEKNILLPYFLKEINDNLLKDNDENNRFFYINILEYNLFYYNQKINKLSIFQTLETNTRDNKINDYFFNIFLKFPNHFKKLDENENKTLIKLLINSFKTNKNKVFSILDKIDTYALNDFVTEINKITGIHPNDKNYINTLLEKRKILDNINNINNNNHSIISKKHKI